jgi:hypothetical protein
MKKIFMMLGAAVLFSLSAMAQVESDSTSNDAKMRQDQTAPNGNNENDGVNDALQTPDPKATDQDGKNEDNGVNNNLEDEKDAVEEGAQKTGEAVEEAGQDVKEAGKEVGEEAEEAAKDAEKAVDDADKKNGNNENDGINDRLQNPDPETKDKDGKGEDDGVSNKLQDDKDQMKEGAEDTKDAVEETGKEVGMEKEGEEPMESAAGSTEASTTAVSFGPDVEVIADKEGPRNEVVYKVADKLYFVDREKEELVEVSESDLRDAQHPAVIHNSGEMQSSEHEMQSSDK